MPHYFHERGKDHKDALEKIRRKYGDNFRILTQRNIPASGILGLFGKEIVEYSGYLMSGKEAREVQKNRDMDNKAAILAKVGIEMPKPKPEPVEESKPVQTMDTVIEEIRNLRQDFAIGASTPPPQPFPILTELADILKENDFTDEYILKIQNLIRGKYTVADLGDRKKVHNAAALAIASSVNYFKQEQNQTVRISVLIGPTGVGKTTTIAKLAAVYGLPPKSRDVRIFTIDCFRIGAQTQIATYGEIMGIEVRSIDDYDVLKSQIALAAEADLILVDTIGKSPRDKAQIEEMKQLLLACGNDAQMHLTLSATTKSSDIMDIIRKFQVFDYQSVIITKLDETTQIGNLISILSETNSCISYITDGQSVPVDIAVASPKRLLGMVNGLEYDREVLEQLYTAVDITAAWR